MHVRLLPKLNTMELSLTDATTLSTFLSGIADLPVDVSAINETLKAFITSAFITSSAPVEPTTIEHVLTQADIEEDAAIAAAGYKEGDTADISPVNTGA
jgi:hypothetical protein